MNVVWEAAATEFSDLSVAQAVQLAIRLVIAAVCGGLIGWERGHSGKTAGLRTHILVSIGAAAFVGVPQQAGMSTDSLRAVIQGVVAGMGFLGAGCILKSEATEQVRGLTTAAGLWLTAALGVAAGMGREASAILMAGAGFFVLAVLGHLEVRYGFRGIGSNGGGRE